MPHHEIASLRIEGFSLASAPRDSDAKMASAQRNRTLTGRRIGDKNISVKTLRRRLAWT
jgi:hypothetical protein